MTDFENEGVALNPASFIQSFLSEGLSARQALAAYREAGGAINNERWFNLYGEIASIVNNRPQLQGLDPTQLPPVEAYSDWAAGTPGRYATFVQVHTSERGSTDITGQFFTYITDRPHSPLEAQEWAEGEAADAAASGGTFEGQTIHGSTVTSMNVTVRR